ncbi:MAG: 3-deoxy-manno-octulosonate cytidylyltransferase (CMP-KDO synthetase) [Halioglobus sp.]|jgi:3-deoxy-manno-octulosonate cytidylyltransferase (CMP-KDO synthetase)
MSFSIVIPSRYASTRLEGKALVDIAGKPMIQRVWEKAIESSAASVVIATDDQRIRDAATSFGAQVCMTSDRHPSGTDRLAQVASDLNMPADHIVVNVQGDEPLIPPAVIDQVAANLHSNQAAAIATLCEEIQTNEEIHNPNAVKVVFDINGMALYFSRATIPWARDEFSVGLAKRPSQGSWFRHIGIYAYRVGFLERFVDWSPAPLEQLEQLEQLRALYNGEAIHVEEACHRVPAGVDTAEDLHKVREYFANGVRV